MNNEKMGLFISDLRKSKQMTQKDLAEKLNVSDKAVSKWERGLSYPDIELLSPLSDILGITTTELLNGEKANNEVLNISGIEESVINALDYGKKATKVKISLTHKVWGASFTILLLIAIMVVTIIDVAISGTFTWSLIPISACIFAWLLFYPIFKFSTKGIVGLLISLSIFILPFLHGLDRAIHRINENSNPEVFRYGLAIVPLALLYLWIAYFLFRKLKNRWLLYAAILVLLACPLNLFTNLIISNLGQPYFNLTNVVSTISTAIVGIILLIIDYVLRRRA